jgi:hypothetical protein
MFDRSGLIEPNDCGDGAGNKSSGRAYKCASDGMMTTNPSNPPPPTATELPYETACVCRIGGIGGRPGPLFVLSLVFLSSMMLVRGKRRRS